jgi:hypothetical protein
MKGVEEIIRKRYSCRSYTGEPLSSAHLAALEGFVSNTGAGPFGNIPRFTVVSAEQGDAETLKGLGTYGFIRKPSGFIIGAVKEGEMALEDYGYLMEKNILYATELGIGTCWLGGSFRKSAFAVRSKAGPDEMIPAVASLGYIAARRRSRIRWSGPMPDRQREKKGQKFSSKRMGEWSGRFRQGRHTISHLKWCASLLPRPISSRGGSLRMQERTAIIFIWREPAVIR